MSTSELSGKLDEMLGGGMYPCNEVASHPGGSSKNLSGFML